MAETYKYVNAPVDIMDVLDAGLAALAADGRFKRIPNGKVEIAWRQPRKSKNGDGGTPARYALTVEFAFVPDGRAA